MSQDKSINLNHLRVFKEVVQGGSFTKAALRLALPKSRVSRIVAALERDLGVQLVYRTTRSLQLTDAGLAFFRRIVEPVELLGDAISDVSTFADEVSGKLRISAPEDMGVALLGDVVKDFIKDYPKVTIELSLDNRPVDLVKEGVDLALRVGRLKDSSLVRRHVGMIRGACVVSPDLAERLGLIKSPKQLESVPFVAFAPTMTTKAEVTMARGDEEITIRPKTSASSNNHFVTRSLALSGAGWTILPAFMAEAELKKGGLVQLLKDWVFDEVPLQFVTPRQREPAPRLERFVSFALERIAPHFV